MMVCSKKSREGVGGGMWEPGPRLADTHKRGLKPGAFVGSWVKSKVV